MSTPNTRTVALSHLRGHGSTGDEMTRTERLLRLARLRGDRLAIATLEHRVPRRWIETELMAHDRCRHPEAWSEAELRAAWGDR